MSITLTTDMTKGLAAIAQLQGHVAQADNYSAAIVNSKNYAAAVEKGYTREVIWSQLTQAQRYAILMRMKEKYGDAPKDNPDAASRQYKRAGTTVERSGGQRQGPMPAGRAKKTAPIAQIL